MQGASGYNNVTQTSDLQNDAGLEAVSYHINSVVCKLLHVLGLIPSGKPSCILSPFFKL